jgi:hypothetical protein
MRTTLALTIIAVGTIWANAPARAQTYPPGYPVCLHVYGPVTYNDCRYTSIEQCKAQASGRPAQCILNPYYVPARPSEHAERRQRPIY